MKYIPLLFQTDMIQAFMANRKTRTRRTRGLNKINEDPDNWEFYRMHDGFAKFCERHNALNEQYIKCPYGMPGDIIWMRESCCNINKSGIDPDYYYKADAKDAEDYDSSEWTWKPSIHMKKEACRNFALIKDIYPERLQDISERDAITEGVKKYETPEGMFWNCYLCEINGKGHCGAHDICGDYGEQKTAKDSFKTLWQNINGCDSWNANPWVWVISFERIEKPLNFI